MNSTYCTEKRVYHISKDSAGLWNCYYRVINPATCAEWQGIKHDRKLSGTHFATYSDGPNYTRVFGPVTEGEFSWDNAPAGTRGACCGYLSEEALLNAIKAL